MTLPPRSLSLLLLAAAVGVAPAGVAMARVQSDPGRPAEPAPSPAGSVALAPDPIVLEGLGLSVRPPLGAVVAREVGGAQVALLLAEAGERPRWRIRIHSLDASSATPLARMVAQDHLNRLEESGRPFTVLASEPREVGGAEAHLLVVSEEGPEQTPIVNGWLIASRGAMSFTVATLATTPTDLPSVQPILEAIAGSLRFVPLDAMVAERQARLDAGAAFIAGLTPEKLKTLLGADDWYRLYRPGTSGRAEQEFGYMHVVSREGQRGELDPQRPATSFSGDEAERGLLLLIQSRGLLKSDGSHVVDVDARYWMAWDRSSEAWSSRSTEREGRAARSSAQTGIRTPTRPGSPTELTVITAATGTATAANREPSTWSVPERHYLCVPEILMLGRLLPRDRTERLELAFFYFDAKERRMPQRLDRWGPAEGDSGQWILTSQPALDEPGSTQHFDASGQRLRRLDADGVVTERIDPTALLDLWKRKGLEAESPTTRTPPDRRNAR